MLQAGIVGLPNVGKSTLFNAVTRSRKAEAANYPFCTIDPNHGIVHVPDRRLQTLQPIARTDSIVPAAIELVDIAGLVSGASRGEGLGNQFLAHIREVDAIIQVVRCFEYEEVVHQMGSIDPIRDIETIAAELILADLQSVENQLANNRRRAKGQDKEAIARVALLEKVREHINDEQPTNTLDLSVEEQERFHSFFLLTAKPTLFACNVDESDLLEESDNRYLAGVNKYLHRHRHAGTVSLCAKLEADLAELSEEEAGEFLEEMGLSDSGVSLLIRQVYDLLGLASFFTIVGQKEVHAWTFTKGMRARQCAGLVHTDFAEGFIKAEVVSYHDLIACGTTARAREAGKYRNEGKDYAVQDGDVIVFRAHS